MCAILLSPADSFLVWRYIIKVIKHIEDFIGNSFIDTIFQMDLIFFEKQEGQLCAQHALNALLQGPYFVATDLADIARRLDNEERGVYSDGGDLDSPEFLQQFQVDSHNMDDSGFFSVQVISEALKIWSLELVPLLSRTDDVALSAQRDPTTGKAYICNFRQHWFTIRKIGYQWFNLNSMLARAELISDTYLHLFLTQLQNEGYSIFVVKGDLHPCVADDELKLYPAATPRPTTKANKQPAVVDVEDDDDEDQMAKALKMSMEQDTSTSNDRDAGPLQKTLRESLANHDADDVSLQQALSKSLADQEDEDLQLALQMSMGEELAGHSNKSEPTVEENDKSKEAAKDLSVEELRQKRLAHLERRQQSPPKNEEEQDKKF